VEERKREEEEEKKEKRKRERVEEKKLISFFSFSSLPNQKQRYNITATTVGLRPYWQNMKDMFEVTYAA
jgi:hypothetical protein